LDTPCGWPQVISDKYDWSQATDELGQRFEISFNSYKPFACGIVVHPSIDAAAQLKAQGVRADDIQTVELRVHSLVLELTGKKTPQDGLQAKFSVYHGVACGLLFGKAAEDEYADAIVTRPDLIALRAKVQATQDDSIGEEQCDMTVVLKNGERKHIFIKHAIGSMQNPLSDAQLEAKFSDLCVPVIGAQKVATAMKAAWELGKAKDISAVAKAIAG
jgi:2-methylcitrate dehydratase PrpD